MTNEARRCGTCKWGQWPKETVVCEFPLPIWVQRALFEASNKMDVDTENCPTWTPKSD